MARLLHAGLLLLSAAVALAGPTAPVRVARALLGPEVWSRVLRIEHRRPDPGHPAVFEALAFAVEDRLWLYNPGEGTQSLSLYAGRLRRDEDDPTPLVREIMPDLIRCVDVTTDGADPRLGAVPGRPAAGREAQLPFGCFIQCVLRLHALQSGDFPPDKAEILAYYVDTSVVRGGHAVLVYRRDSRTFVYDPDGGDRPTRLADPQPAAPLALARAICRWGTPVKAQVLALHAPAPSRPAIASLGMKPRGPGHRPDSFSAMPASPEFIGAGPAAPVPSVSPL